MANFYLLGIFHHQVAIGHQVNHPVLFIQKHQIRVFAYKQKEGTGENGQARMYSANKSPHPI
jgi:hypothetical protein